MNLSAVPIGVGAALLGAATTLELPRTLIGWMGVLGTLLGALALYRAGSVRAWKETAEGRGSRVLDLERELVELRAELAIPERIEGIIRLMDESTKRGEESANARLERGLERMDERWGKHDAAAEVRTQRLERAIEGLVL